MPHKNKVLANTFTYFDATLLAVTFRICEPGLPHPIELLKIINTSDVDVFISYDGVYPNDIVMAHDQFDLYLQTNARSKSHVALMEKGMKVYVAWVTNPGKGGYIYVISYYQPMI